MRNLTKLLIIMVMTFSFTSCNEEPLQNNTTGKQENNLKVDYKIININPENVGKSETQTYLMDYSYGKSVKTIRLYEFDNKNYGYDFDLNGEVDLRVEIGNDKNKATYITNNGNIAGYGTVETNSDNSIHTLHLESVANKNPYDEGWTECFESAAGSPEGITASVVSAFFGPEATAGLYAGFAIGCYVLN